MNVERPYRIVGTGDNCTITNLPSGKLLVSSITVDGIDELRDLAEALSQIANEMAEKDLK